MAPPLVTIYVTSLTSAPKVRKHIDLLRRSLSGLEIPYEEFDLVMDEEAKKKWQRSKPPGMVVGLPGYLVGGEWVGTMDDFEDAVETQTLETFLKQDIDLSHPKDPSTTSSSNVTSGSLPTQKSIQEVELENLMREMTNEDLDKLMGELGVDESAGKVGLISNNEIEQQKEKEEKKEEGISDIKQTDKGILDELKKELNLDENEDKILKGVEGDEFSKSSSSTTKSDSNDLKSNQSEVIKKDDKKDDIASKSETKDQGEGIKSMIEENEVLKELKKELNFDKNEDKDIDDIITSHKAKVD